jgi:hypothetical protein
VFDNEHSLHLWKRHPCTSTLWRQLTDWREQVTTWRDLRGLMYIHNYTVCLYQIKSYWIVIINKYFNMGCVTFRSLCIIYHCSARQRERCIQKDTEVSSHNVFSYRTSNTDGYHNSLSRFEKLPSTVFFNLDVIFLNCFIRYVTCLFCLGLQLFLIYICLVDSCLQYRHYIAYWPKSAVNTLHAN